MCLECSRAPCTSKPARNARCVDRSSTKPHDSSRAVANTRDVARFDASRHAREKTARDEKENLPRSTHLHHFATRSARVDALWTRVQRDVVARSARIRCAFARDQRASSSNVACRRAFVTRDASSSLLLRANHAWQRAATHRGCECIHTRVSCGENARSPKRCGRDEARDQVPGLTM